MNDAPTPPPSDDAERAEGIRRINDYLDGREEMKRQTEEPLPADFGALRTRTVEAHQETVWGIAGDPLDHLARVNKHLTEHGAQVPAETLRKVLVLLTLAGDKQDRAESIGTDISWDVGAACVLLGLPQTVI